MSTINQKCMVFAAFNSLVQTIGNWQDLQDRIGATVLPDQNLSCQRTENLLPEWVIKRHCQHLPEIKLPEVNEDRDREDGREDREDKDFNFVKNHTKQAIGRTSGTEIMTEIEKRHTSA